MNINILQEEFTLSVPMAMSDGDCIAYCPICCEVTVHGADAECKAHEKVNYNITEDELLAMRFEKIETDNPLLGGYYFRNPKFRVKLDPWLRLFVARPRWEGKESFWKEIPYNGKAELIQFIREWIQD